MRETYWLEDFGQTCQDIMEDACLLEALAARPFDGVNSAVFSRTLTRLSDYLSQHVWDLHNLEKRLGRTSQ